MAPAQAGVGRPGSIGLAPDRAKLCAGAVLLGVWEVSIAKMRVFRFGEFLGGAFVFAFLAILLPSSTREVLAVTARLRHLPSARRH